MADARRAVIWSPEALLDLNNIWNFCAGAAGPDNADAVLRGLGKATTTIAMHPSVGREREEIRTGLRSIVVSPHVVFYRLNSGRPEIVRVLDARRDIDALFTEGDF